MDGDEKLVSMGRANEPKKYIRTFAGDAAALESGGMPELVPFDGIQSNDVPAPPKEAVLQENVPESEQPVAPPPRKAVEDFPLPVPPQEPTYSPSIRPRPKPLPLPTVPKPPVPLPQAVVPEARPSPIQTYASDFSERVHAEHASPLTVLAAEQDSRSPKVDLQSPELKKSRRNLGYVIAGVALLVIGCTGAYVAYGRYLAARAPVFLAPAVSAPIFVDERAQVSGTGAVLEQAIEQSVASPLGSGAVRLLYSTDATTTNNNLFIDLALPAPGILTRNVVASGGMAGVVNAGGTQSPFFILSVTSYTDTFAGMLSWEPSMPRDLAGLFPPSVETAATTTSATRVATTTNQTLRLPVQFVDSVVANHDVREYRDAAGHTVMLYGYWNQSTLIIARNAAAFTELVDRLATSRSQ